VFNDPVVVVFAGINDVNVTVWVPLFIVVVVDAVFTTFTIAITSINIKLKGLFALAETVGQMPHIFLQIILEKGITRLLFIITLLTLLLTAGVNELIRTYASLLYRSAVLSLEFIPRRNFVVNKIYKAGL
jgi:hypothetical protein